MGYRIASVLTLAVLAPAAAQAQFYDMDGAYRCVTKPDAACTKGLGDAPPPAPTQPTGKDAKEAADAPALAGAITRVKEGAPTADDIHLLEARAAAKDAHAIEVLAWCKLNGIGTPGDAVGAYWLYRDAAGLGVTKARENQIAIFETRLTSDQRQQVLLQEDSR
jgi:hypothetical protein